VPKVSVIINCRNGEKYLRGALDSVYSQTYGNWEIILWDDASIDTTPAIATGYDDKLKYFRGEKARSLGEARNWAIEKASGVYVAFLDHDDLWLPDKLEQQVVLMNHNPDAILCYTNHFRQQPNGRLVLAYKRPQPEGYVFESLLRYYQICLSTVMVRKKVLQRPDMLFDESLSLCEEYDVFMRILYYFRAAYINVPLAVYRIHSNMLSKRWVERWPDEMAHSIKKLEAITPDFKTTYRKTLTYLDAKIGYWRARAEMELVNPAAARASLRPYKGTDVTFFILYLLTYSPSLWHILHKLKEEWRLG